jgi:nitrate/nitrite-specific signal transduction histidine kinase
MWMLVILFFAAVLALGAGLAWMTRRQQVGLRRLAWGLKRLQRGQYEFRLESDRRDEFASAFRQFNQLAVRLDELSRSAQMEPRRATRSGSVPADAKPDQTLDLGDDETAESAEETAANVTRLR